MAASDAEICNLALSHIGSGHEIATLSTEKSQEASACRRFFDTSLDLLLREFPWPFCTKIVALALVQEDPNTEWKYEYTYPTDAVVLHRVLGFGRHDNRQTRIPYRVRRGSASKVIWADQEDACLEYSFREKDFARYPADFTMALSLLLAFYIAPRISKGDPFQMRERITAMYFQAVSSAKASALNEEQPDEDRTSEYERYRSSDTQHPNSGQDPLDFLGVP